MNKNLYVKDLIFECKGRLIKGEISTPLESFSKDTRTIKKGEVFVGIKGESFDGNTLYKEALEKGASGCILNNDIEYDIEFIYDYPDAFIVQVDDTIKCLQDLAAFKRSLYDIPVIGVTGSVGKTSTKDIIASVLSKKFKVLKTEGNYNNHLGVPLTILRLKDHDALVVEMGMNNLGEISVLSKIAKPTAVVITNVGTSHIGNLGSRENILKAKLEILEGLCNNGLIVINNDNDLLHKWYLENNEKYNINTFGINNKSNYNGINILEETLFSKYDVLINNKLYNFQINVPGGHFILNSLCALTIGAYFEIPIEDIKDGIENFILTKKRMEIEVINNITIINDCYNANLDSMTSAINYLGTLKNTRKIALLGDMLELGDFSEELHRLVGKCVFDNKIDILITVGNNSKYIKDECLKLGMNKNNIYSYDSNEDALNLLKELLHDNDTLLIKASNGMKFTEIYNKLKDAIN